MRDRGDLNTDADPAALALATLAALQGGLLLTQVHRSTVPLEIALDQMLARIESQTTWELSSQSTVTGPPPSS